MNHRDDFILSLSEYSRMTPHQVYDIRNNVSLQNNNREKWLRAMLFHWERPRSLLCSVSRNEQDVDMRGESVSLTTKEKRMHLWWLVVFIEAWLLPRCIDHQVINVEVRLPLLPLWCFDSKGKVVFLLDVELSSSHLLVCSSNRCTDC